jgi:hypothetical protein
MVMDKTIILTLITSMTLFSGCVLLGPSEEELCKTSPYIKSLKFTTKIID